MRPQLPGLRPLLLLAALALCALSPAAAQGGAAANFYRHLLQGREQLAELYFVRGQPFSCDDMPGEDEVIREIQDLLTEQRACLFYFHEGGVLYTYLVRRDGLYHVLQRVDRDSLSSLEQQLRASLGIAALALDRSPVKRGLEVVLPAESAAIHPDDAIRNMTGLLFPPGIREALRGIRNLIIQPVLNIGLLPFAITRPFDDEPGSVLIDSISYAIAPHICNIFNLSARNMNWNREVFFSYNSPLLVGDPEYYQGEYYFPPLPGAHSEVERVKGMTGGHPYTGEAAGIAVVKEKAKHADLLYFATHAIADPDSPLDGTFLALTPDNSSETGYWTARDIQHFPLKNTKLAILSACQTGYGKVLDAGYIGLGRVFFKAGVPNTISSLWNVDDAATASLMVMLMEELQQPSRYFPASALQRAMLRQKALTPEPRYWAPFMVFGFGN